MNILKKISLLLISCSFLLAAVGDTYKECTEPEVVEFMPVGDTTGHYVFTKKEETRECNITTTKLGRCLQWEESKDNFSYAPAKYNVYESANYSTTLGTLLSALGAYDQIEHLWSGWHGYCEIGVKTDFNWAEDPMFWASLAMSAYMSSGGESGDTLSNSVQDSAASAGVELTTQQATCVAAATYNTAKNIGSYVNDLKNSMGDGECDPVDEVCSNTDQLNESEDIYTMDEVQFNDLVEEFANNGENLYDYIVTVPPSPDNGIVRFRMKEPQEMTNITNSTNSDQIEEIRKKLAKLKLEVQMVSDALTFANCMSGTGSANVSLPADTDDRSTATTRETVSYLADYAAQYMGPYGPLISASIKVLAYTATSFKNVDTCSNEEDAQEAGKRQEQTQKALKYNLCHFVKEECVETNFIDSLAGKDCSLTGYYYCCYDQLLTKILVEQLKAELGRDWTHCTGITIRDLNYVSFRQCTDSEMSDGIDGAHQTGDYDPEEAFQYKHKCMDLTEFVEYLQQQMGEKIDINDFKDYWNNITQQNPYGGTSSY